MAYEHQIEKSKIEVSDHFNLARGHDLYVVASICQREGLGMPALGDRVRCGFCDDAGTPAAQGDASHFGWTLNPVEAALGS